MKILVGTNFSAHADEASLALAGLAARNDGMLTLAHVINPLQYRRPSREFVTYLRCKRQEMLENLANRARTICGDVESVVVEGSPAAELVNLTRMVGADLLALSSSGPMSLFHSCLGSTTNTIVQRASVPVILIRKPDRFDAWVSGRRPLKVLIGYGFCASSDAALRWARTLRNVAPCEFTVAYAAVAGNESTRWALGSIMSPIFYPVGVKKLLERELRQCSDSVLGENAAHICVRADWSRPASHLIEIADETQADLIVVGTNQRQGFARVRSVSGSVLRDAHLNIAFVPVSVAGTSKGNESHYAPEDPTKRCDVDALATAL